jgi:glycosyltransferase involved in cell wall biosynthesis
MIPDLSIIVPTLNERDNIIPFVTRLGQVLDGAEWEVIFVDDDSQDGTLDVLQSLARGRPNPLIRLSHEQSQKSRCERCNLTRDSGALSKVRNTPAANHVGAAAYTTSVSTLFLAPLLFFEQASLALHPLHRCNP